MYWLEVSVVTDGEGAEAVAEALRPFAYQNGVVLEQLGDSHNPDPDALEPAVTVKIYLPEAEDTAARRRQIEEILYHLGRMYPLPEPIFRQLKEEDWANAWKENYHPFRVGQRVWIRPSWLDKADEAQSDDIVLTLDPGMAFGTGLHPTTQLCLQALEQLVRSGMSVLDVGTGSGILAILAAMWGAARVGALHTD
jgi:ribosomal protein L11 methyltransferase